MANLDVWTRKILRILGVESQTKEIDDSGRN